MMRKEAEVGCTLSGMYVAIDLSSCTQQIVIDTLTVPKETTLDLKSAPQGMKILVNGVVTFTASPNWAGPLVELTNTKSITVSSSGTFDSNGKAYWSSSQSATRPIFFKAWNMVSSTLSS